eukprot:SAG31_NODE_18140_length_645_cov_1.624542_2_plen_82_part_00
MLDAHVETVLCTVDTDDLTLAKAWGVVLRQVHRAISKPISANLVVYARDHGSKKQRLVLALVFREVVSSHVNGESPDCNTF